MMESAAIAGAAASSSAMSLSTSTVSLSTESTRNPRIVRSFANGNRSR